MKNRDSEKKEKLQKKKVVRHLKDDIKTFEKEKADDKKLLKKLKKR